MGSSRLFHADRPRPTDWRRAALLAAVLAVAAPAAGIANEKKDADKKDDKGKRASLVLKANPTVAFSPARVFITGELRGGSNDDADLYCPEVQWDWGDGTVSEANQDCEPFEAGKSEIKRRWSTLHTFTSAGSYRLELRLMRGDRAIVVGSTTVQVRPGLRDMEDTPQ